jgi:predicted MFS family arabinose efflux permease
MLLLALGGLSALAVAMGIGRFIYTPLLPLMERALDLSKSQAGILASANYLGYMAGALLAASPFVPGSRRLWMLAGLGISAVTTGAMGLADGMVLFAVLRFLGGVASAFVLVFCSALVVQRLMLSGYSVYASLHFAGVGTGIALSAVLVTAMVAADASWRGIWIGSGALSLVVLGMVAALVRADTGAPPPVAGPTAPRPALLRTLIVSYGLFGFGYVITATFVVSMVRDIESVRVLEPVIWLVVGVSAAPSVWFWSKVAVRIGLVNAYAWAFVIEAIGIATSVLWPTIPGLMITAVFLGGTIMGITALGLMAAGDLSRRDPRRTMALMTASFGLGQVIGPLFAGMVADRTGNLSLPSLVASAALIAGAAMVFRRLRYAPR